MSKVLVLVALLTATLATSAYAQRPAIPAGASADTAKWPACQLGRAPIAPGPAPREASVFKTSGGPVIMSEAGPRGAVRFVTCGLPEGAEVYRSADGTLRDLPSNQPFWPVGWDATTPQPIAGRDGSNGHDGAAGLQGPKGDKGDPGSPGSDAFLPSYYSQHQQDVVIEKRGMSKTKKAVIGGIIVAAAAGGVACGAHYRGWCESKQQVAQAITINGQPYNPAKPPPGIVIVQH